MKKSIKLTAVCALTTGLTLASGPGTATAGPSDFTAAPISASQAKSLAGKSARNQETTLNMYSVMTDRFANGDPSNDTGGISGGPLQHGFDATKKQFYNGGDIKGLTEKLDYIQSLGMNAIWITPPYRERPGADPAQLHLGVLPRLLDHRL